MKISEIMSIGKEYFVNGLVSALLYAILIYIIGTMIKRVSAKYFQHKIDKYGKEASTTYGFGVKMVNLLVNITMLLLIIMEVKAFQRLGTTLLGASGIIAVVVGLAAQESMSNFIGGFFLSFYKPFNVGDLITISEKNLVGTVQEIGLRHTIIRTLSNSRIVVPNSIMNSAIIENKDNDAKFGNFLYFNISYDSDIDKAIDIIQKCCLKHKDCVDNRTAVEKENNVLEIPVYVTSLKDYSIELRATIMSEDAPRGFTMCCDLRKEIKLEFDKNGVVIPYPTQTIIQNKKD